MSNINRVNINNLGLERTGSVQPRDEVKSSSSGLSPVRDSVELSGKAKTMDRLAGLIHQSGNERIQQIRQMIEAGTYSVSSAEIAKKMIESGWR